VSDSIEATDWRSLREFAGVDLTRSFAQLISNFRIVAAWVWTDRLMGICAQRQTALSTAVLKAFGDSPMDSTKSAANLATYS